MRILFVGSFVDPWSTHHSLVKELRNKKHKVVVFDFRNIALNNIRLKNHLYSVNFRFLIGERLITFVVANGSKPERDDSSHQIGIGLLYKVSNNFVIDVSANQGLKEIAPDNIMNIGFSWRIPK